MFVLPSWMDMQKGGHERKPARRFAHLEAFGYGNSLSGNSRVVRLSYIYLASTACGQPRSWVESGLDTSLLEPLARQSTGRFKLGARGSRVNRPNRQIIPARSKACQNPQTA